MTIRRHLNATVILGAGLAAFVAVLFLRLGTPRPAGPIVTVPGKAREMAASQPAASEHTIRAVDEIVRRIGSIEDATGSDDMPTKVGLESASSTSKDRDLEWNAIPRSKSLLHEIVVNGPLAAHNLYRNIHTNPRDIFVDRLQRAELDSYCSAIDPQIRALVEVRGRSAAGDLMNRIRSRTSRTSTLAESRAKATPAERKMVASAEDGIFEAIAKKLGRTVASVREDPTSNVVVPAVDLKELRPLAFSVASGVLHYGDSADLPSAREAQNALRWAACEAAVRVVGFFANAGCLSAAEGESLLEATLIEIDERFGN